MSHFSPDEFVDAAEGTLPGTRAEHLFWCERCASEVTAIRAALAATRDVEVPEPSPLYWPHLAARVRERTADETIAPAWRAGDWWQLGGARRVVPLASAAALCAVVAVGLMTREAHAPAPVASVVTSSSEPGEPPVAPDDDTEVWRVLTSAASETPIEDAHAAGMGLPAGAVERAVQRMTPDELTELQRLLQSELRRSSD